MDVVLHGNKPAINKNYVADLLGRLGFLLKNCFVFKESSIDLSLTFNFVKKPVGGQGRKAVGLVKKKS